MNSQIPKVVQSCTGLVTYGSFLVLMTEFYWEFKQGIREGGRGGSLSLARVVTRRALNNCIFNFYWRSMSPEFQTRFHKILDVL